MPSRYSAKTGTDRGSGVKNGFSGSPTKFQFQFAAVDRFFADRDQRAAHPHSRHDPPGERACRHPGGRLAGGGAAAAAVVAKAVFHVIGVVGMAGPVLPGDLAIVLERWSTLSIIMATGVPVVTMVTPSSSVRTPDRMRTSSGSRRCVTKRDWPGRRLSRSAWISASVKRMPGRAAVDHAAERRTVALAPGGDPKQMSEGVVRHVQCGPVRRGPALGRVLLSFAAVVKRRRPLPPASPTSSDEDRKASKVGKTAFKF